MFRKICYFVLLSIVVISLVSCASDIEETVADKSKKSGEVLSYTSQSALSGLPSKRIAGEGLRKRLLYFALTEKDSKNPYKVSSKTCKENIKDVFGSFVASEEIDIEQIEKLYICTFYDSSEVSVQKNKNISVTVYAYRVIADGKEGFAVATDDLRLGDVLYVCPEGRWEEQPKELADNLKDIAEQGTQSMAQVWNALTLGDLKNEFPFADIDTSKGIACAITASEYTDWQWESAVEPETTENVEDLVQNKIKSDTYHLNVPLWNQHSMYNDVFILLHLNEILDDVPMSGMEMVCSEASGDPSWAKNYWKLNEDQSLGCVPTAFSEVIAFYCMNGLFGGDEFEKFDLSLLDILTSDTDRTFAAGNSISKSEMNGTLYLNAVGLTSTTDGWKWTKGSKAGQIWDGTWDWELMATIPSDITLDKAKSDDERIGGFMISCFMGMFDEYQRAKMQFFPSSKGTSSTGDMFFSEDIHDERYPKYPKPGLLLKNGYSAEFYNGGFIFNSKMTAVDTHLFFDSIKNKRPVLVGDMSHEYLFDGCIIKSRNHKVIASRYDEGYQFDEKEDSEEIRYYHVNWGWGGACNGWVMMPADLDYRMQAYYNMRQDKEKLTYTPPKPTGKLNYDEHKEGTKTLTLFQADGTPYLYDMVDGMLTIDTKADMVYSNLGGADNFLTKGKEVRDLYFIFSNPTDDTLALPTIEVVDVAKPQNKSSHAWCKNYKDDLGSTFPEFKETPANLKIDRFDIKDLPEEEKQRFLKDKADKNLEVGQTITLRHSLSKGKYNVILRREVETLYGVKTLVFVLYEGYNKDTVFPGDALDTLADLMLKENKEGEDFNDIYDWVTALYGVDWYYEDYLASIEKGNTPYTDELVCVIGPSATCYGGYVADGLNLIFLMNSGGKFNVSKSNLCHELQHCIFDTRLRRGGHKQRNNGLTEIFSKASEELTDDLLCKLLDTSYCSNTVEVAQQRIGTYKDRVGKVLSSEFKLLYGLGSAGNGVLYINGMNQLSTFSLGSWPASNNEFYNYNLLVESYIVRNFGIDVFNDFLGKVGIYYGADRADKVGFKDFVSYLRDRFFGGDPNYDLGTFMQQWAVAMMLSGHRTNMIDTSTTYSDFYVYERESPYKYNFSNYSKVTNGFKTYEMTLPGGKTLSTRLSSVNFDNFIRASSNAYYERYSGLGGFAVDSTTQGRTIAPRTTVVLKVPAKCEVSTTPDLVLSDVRHFGLKEQYVRLKVSGDFDDVLAVCMVCRSPSYGLAFKESDLDVIKDHYFTMYGFQM